MAYAILQDRPPAAEPGLVENRLNSPLNRPVRVWSAAIRHPHFWTADYCDLENVRMTVAPQGVECAPFLRARRTWHLYAPGISYREWYGTEARFEHLWFFFKLSKPWPLLAGRPWTVLYDPEERLAQLVRTMYAVQQSREHGSRLILLGHLQTALGEICAAAFRGGAGTPERPWLIRGPQAAASSGELLARVDALVARRLDRPPGLDELARALHLSVSSLAHRFKAEAGMTVVERIRWLRVREARRLLGERRKSVKDAASALGFSSPFYFSKVFKEVTGLAPQSFLRGQTGH